MSHEGARTQTRVDGIMAEGQASGGDRRSVVDRVVTEAATVANLVETTLGPHGQDKILYRKLEREEEGLDDYFQVTNSGAYILKHIPFEAPAAAMIARVAAAQDDRYGDGTTTAAVYAGRMLEVAADLIDRGFHPRTVIAGIDEAVPLVGDAIDEVAVPLDTGDRDRIAGLVHTTLGGTVTEPLADELVAWLRAAAGDGSLDPDAVHTESLRAGNLSASEFVDGLVLKKSFAGNYSPESLANARIAMTKQAITASQQVIDRIESAAADDAEQTLTVEPSSAADLQRFTERERELVEASTRPLVDADVDVLLVANRVDDATVAHLDRAGIAVVRNADQARLKALARATNGSFLPHLGAFEPADAGAVGSITRREYPEVKQEVIFFRELPGDIASVLLHGSTWMAGWEAKRNVNAAAAAVASALETGRIVPGGGATEMAIAQHLRDAAPGVGGRESMVIEAMADAFEAIPRLLARNAGMDQTDAVLDLRTAHSRGKTDAAVLGRERTIDGALDAGVVEPVAFKRGSVHTAAGATTTLLRIDDVITGIDVTVSDAP
ncbi:MAG: TCP-1/cpn60 chaperonin family protein [Natronomonas sp.]|uniref:TCP-1/cpn60 chaperonin family protein n=1 Tax=Natronomonas sp. TaxID=2184060 RepID=UPI002870B1A4|nr:TCP-1/cpn60 chaperonin family protein [Natronomonas sp.]MDR9430639.1 TCP-1/cpn60 chaperonin family protein [Natronomonas sp.]